MGLSGWITGVTLPTVVASVTFLSLKTICWMKSPAVIKVHYGCLLLFALIQFYNGCWFPAHRSWTKHFRHSRHIEYPNLFDRWKHGSLRSHVIYFLFCGDPNTNTKENNLAWRYGQDPSLYRAPTKRGSLTRIRESGQCRMQLYEAQESDGISVCGHTSCIRKK